MFILVGRGREGWFHLLEVVYGRAGGVVGFFRPPAADVCAFWGHRVICARHDGRVGHEQAVGTHRTTNAVRGFPPIPRLCPLVYVVTDHGDGTIGDIGDRLLLSVRTRGIIIKKGARGSHGCRAMLLGYAVVEVSSYRNENRLLFLLEKAGGEGPTNFDSVQRSLFVRRSRSCMYAAAAGFLRTWLSRPRRVAACCVLRHRGNNSGYGKTARHSLDYLWACEILLDGGLKCVQVEEALTE